ncbi:MAG: flippase-like domain-containing protein [Planctomycetes bacterium]|nr:flippase-like domain-containing protein [Planctomycetota bacterium]
MTHPTRRGRALRKLALRLVALVALFWIIASIVDLHEVADSLGAFSPGIIALGFGLGLLRAFLLSVRWRILDEAGIAEREAALGHPLTHLRQWQYFRYRLANATFNLFLPTAVGADVARAALMASEVADDRTRRVLVILFDRIIGLVSIGVLGLIAGIIAPNLAHKEKYVTAIAILNVVLFSILALGFSGWVRTLAHGIFRRLGSPGVKLSRTTDAIGECFDTFLRHKRHVMAATAVCIAVHATSFVLVWLAAFALGVELSYATLAIVTTISWVIVLVPVTIGGLGLREVAFVVLLAPQGVSEADATALSLFQFAVIVMVGIAGIPVTVFGKASRTTAD